MASSPTKPGTTRLSDVARHVVRPEGIVSSGWAPVEAKCRDLGIDFDEWQRGAGRLILSKTADGKYAATVGGVGMSLPRQVGKTYLVGAIAFALCIIHPGLTVIWTAHHSRTAGETFLSMQGFARRKKVEPHIEAVFRGSGDEEIRFRNGSRILFGARERGFGRGFAGVDVLVCDEAQILTDRALDNMLATMNTAPNALPLFMGTPPKPEDPSEAFGRIRADALSGDASDLVWIECGADEKSDPDDRKQWAKANPSYPHRTPLTSMVRLRKKLTADSWMREGLGVWDSEEQAVFDVERWPLLVDMAPELIGPCVVGVDRAPDRRTWAIAAAQRTKSGVAHVEVGFSRSAAATDVVEYLVDVVTAWNPVAVVIDQRSPAGVLKPLLIEAGIEPVMTNTTELALACEGFVEAYTTKQLSHSDQEILNSAVLTAVKRDLPSGAFAWDRRPGGTVTHLVAATLAHWGLLALTEPTKGPLVTPRSDAKPSNQSSDYDAMSAAF